MHEQFIILKSNQKEKTTIQNIDFLQLYLNEVHIPFVISFGRFFSPFLEANVLFDFHPNITKLEEISSKWSGFW